MKRIAIIKICFLIAASFFITHTLACDLHFSTYIGGSNMDQMRDIDVDKYGNIYITGGTESINFPVTPGAYDTTHNGWFDVFVMKFDPDGSLIWSTFVGGPNYDRAYAIKVDNQGYTYVTGRGGPGFPVTPGAFQTQFKGYYNGIYGDQNAFVFKLEPDGSNLIWASYFGVSTLIRDCDIDDNGDIYVTSGYVPGQSPDTLLPAWVVNAFQKSPQGGMDGVVAKIKSDGSQVLWATYFGGSGDEGVEASIRIDTLNRPYILQFTQSTDMPFSSTAYDTTHNGGWDFFVAKLMADGSDCIFGTYLGGSQHEFTSTHNITVDDPGNAYVLAPTQSSDYPTTPGVFQENYGGGSSDIAVSKISSDGSQLLLSTFISGNDLENGDGVSVDSSGNVYFGGDTYSLNYPVTPDAYQNSNAGAQDGILVKLKADFTELLYSTYFGGSNDDGSRSSTLDDSGSFYYAGWTKSTDFPLKNPWQDSLVGDWDLGLAKFVPAVAVEEQTDSKKKSGFCISSSNPAREFLVRYSLENPGVVKLTLYDCTGRMAKDISFFNRAGTHNVKIKTDGLKIGVYFLQFETGAISTKEKLVLIK
jgi:hypothetical protein